MDHTGHQSAAMVRIYTRRANAFSDHAASESFFGMLKRERVNRRQYRTRAEARTDVFDYIERFHNPRKMRKIERLRKEDIGLTQPSVKKG